MAGNKSDSDSQQHGKTDDMEVITTDSILVSSFQALGSKYSHNEDSLFVFHSKLLTDEKESDFGIFIVGDGMGGHASGEIASGLAVRLMAEKVFRNLYLPLLLPENLTNLPPIQEVLENAVKEVNHSVFQKVPEGGTTLTAVITYGDSFFISQIGDSRAYLIKESEEIEQLTEDQTLVQRLISMGQFTKEEARNYPQRNVLYNAIGRSDSIEPAVYIRRRPGECALLLCSDGLWDVVDEKDIAKIVHENYAPNKACRVLVESALKNGGQDNISVILVRFASS